MGIQNERRVKRKVREWKRTWDITLHGPDLGFLWAAGRDGEFKAGDIVRVTVERIERKRKP